MGGLETRRRPRQHFPHQAARALWSLVVPLVRAANNGISALVDPYGRVVAKLNLNERGVVDVSVPVVAPAPLLCTLWRLDFCTKCADLIGLLRRKTG